MDEQEQRRFQEWASTKWKNPNCPVCGDNRWEPAPNLGQIPNLLPFGPKGGNTIPVVLINCTNCGYTLPINAVVAGILQTPPSAQPDLPPPGEEVEAVETRNGDQ